VHDKYGMFLAHQCFSNCKQSCAVACAVRGVSSVEGFDLESSVDVGLQKNPVAKADAHGAVAILVQAGKEDNFHPSDSLPTMD